MLRVLVERVEGMHVATVRDDVGEVASAKARDRDMAVTRALRRAAEILGESADRLRYEVEDMHGPE